VQVAGTTVFWRRFGAALVCYVAAGIVNGLIGGRVAVTAPVSLVLATAFGLWAAKAPRPAAIGLAVLVGIGIPVVVTQSALSISERAVAVILSAIVVVLAVAAARCAPTTNKAVRPPPPSVAQVSAEEPPAESERIVLSPAWRTALIVMAFLGTLGLIATRHRAEGGYVFFALIALSSIVTLTMVAINNAIVARSRSEPHPEL
jgi:hypothetical protein